MPELRHQQKNSRQSLFAGVEKLIDQIILISDVPLQQIFDKHGRQFWLQAQSMHHRLLLNMQKNAVRHSNRRRHARELTRKTALSKEITFAQNAKRCLFSGFRHNREPDLPLFDKKQPVRWIPLSKDRIFLLKRLHISALTDG